MSLWGCAANAQPKNIFIFLWSKQIIIFHKLIYKKKRPDLAASFYINLRVIAKNKNKLYYLIAKNCLWVQQNSFLYWNDFRQNCKIMIDSGTHFLLWKCSWFTFQDLRAKIYSYTKKVIWHLAIRQNWCFGQSYHSRIGK